MSPPQEPTELIYQRSSSAMPALFAAGLAGVVVGLYAWWPYAVIGGVVALICLFAWWGSERREIAAMPNSQHTDTAPIPLSGRE